MIVEHVGILAILQKDFFNIKEISESIAVDNYKSMIATKVGNLKCLVKRSAKSNIYLLVKESCFCYC
jgi:hypothetical protein